MRAWRLVKARYADAPLDPAGARRYGGRWNSPGVEAVYAADSIALAALELLVHLQDSAVLDRFVLCRLRLDDDLVQRLDPADLPADWRRDPPPPATRRIGDQWLAGGQALALQVPSTVVPQQHNLLLNPRHPAFAALVEGVQVEPFRFDPRLAGPSRATS